MTLRLPRSKAGRFAYRVCPLGHFLLPARIPGGLCKE
jgi:hypothetical protein